MKKELQLWLAAFFTLAATCSVQAKVQIKYLTWNGNGVAGEARRKAIAAFEAKHPDIEIKTVLAAYTNYYGRYLEMSAKGSAPDVAEMPSDLVWKLVNNRLVEDLNRYLNNDRVTGDNLIREYLINLTHKGILAAIPISYTVSALAYNYGMFLDTAVPFPSYYTKQNTWNWDNFLITARKLTKDRNGDGKVDTWGYGQNAIWTWDYWVYGNGGSLLNSEFDKCTLDSPESIQGLQFQVDLVHKYKVAPITGYFVDDFTNGKAAMCQASTWMFSQWKAKGQALKWDIAGFPYEKKPYTQMNSTGLVISKQSRRKKDAWDFIKYMAGTEAQRLLSPGNGGAVPANLNVARSEVFLGQKPPESMEVLVYEALKADAQRTPWGIPLPDRFMDTLDLEIARLWASGDSAANVVTKITPGLNRMLDDFNRKKIKKR